jgi:hypothetical protein
MVGQKKSSVKGSAVKRPIQFSPRNYKTLLTALFIANWVINGSTTDERNRDFDDLEDLVFSHAGEFGMKKYANKETTHDGRAYPTEVFEKETDVQSLLDTYDDEVFWTELARHLAWRDFMAHYGVEAIANMSDAVREKLVEEYEKKYETEIEIFGIDRMFFHESGEPKKKITH